MIAPNILVHVIRLAMGENTRFNPKMMSILSWLVVESIDFENYRRSHESSARDIVHARKRICEMSDHGIVIGG
jgi:hypothetical protein